MKKKGLLLLTLMLTGISVFGQKAVDMDKGMKYWEKAQIAYEKKDYSETFKNNKKSAELGCPRGMLSLGVCYACAYGTQKDREMSLFWYKKANEHPEDSWSYPRSFLNMANYYAEVKNDLVKSAQLLAEGMNFLTEDFEYWYKNFKNRYSKYVKNYKDFAYVSDYFETLGYGKTNQEFPFKRSFEMRSNYAIEKVKALVENGNKEASVAWAKYLYNDKGTAQDKATAISIWEKFSDLDISKEMLIIAKSDGLFKKDIPKEWYSKNPQLSSLYNKVDYVKVNGLYYGIVKTKRIASAGSDKGDLSGHIIIPSKIVYDGETYTVNEIRDFAFCNSKEITSIEIPNSVIKIGEKAFSGCAALTTINIPSSVTDIDKGAFSNCVALTSISIPNNVSEIDVETFDGCSNLKTVSFGSGVQFIRQKAFRGCKGLLSIFIPNTISEIGDEAFAECWGLTSIIFGGGLKYIGRYSFKGCSNLSSITIPNNVTELGSYAFEDCRGLESITIGNGLNYIGVSTFQRCTGLKSVIIPNNITKIYASAFEECCNLTSVTLSNQLTSIGKYAFSSCNLSSINIPNSVKELELHCFCDNVNLKSATVPSTVDAKNNAIFNSCKNLAFVTVRKPNGSKTQSKEGYWFRRVLHTNASTTKAKPSMSECIDWDRSSSPSGDLISFSEFLPYKKYQYVGEIKFKNDIDNYVLYNILFNSKGKLAYYEIVYDGGMKLKTDAFGTKEELVQEVYRAYLERFYQ
jgi:TPR repeat protein